jgi:hypothetical protein
MGLISLVQNLWSDKQNVAYRPPQAYDGAGVGAYNIFNINGAVRILLLGGRATAAAGAGTTLINAINGVNDCAGAVDIGTGCLTGEVWVSPLNVAGAMLGALGGLPLTDALLHSKGFLAGDSVGTIVATFAVGTWTGEIFCVYQKMTPAASITVV